MRHSLIVLALLAPCSLFASSAMAKDADAHKGNGWSAGIGAAWSPNPYKSYKNRAWPVPTVAYEGKSFYWRGPAFGYRLVSNEAFELSVVASLHPQRFRAKDSRDAQLRQLDDRDFSGVAGLDARWKGEWGALSASAKKEFTGHGGGIVGDLNYSYPIPTGRVTWIPTVGVEYADAEINDYYYGVSTAEAARSGLAAYAPGSTLTPYLSIAARIQLNQRWSAMVGVRSTRLADDVKDSPMVGRSQAQGYLASVNYRF